MGGAHSPFTQKFPIVRVSMNFTSEDGPSGGSHVYRARGSRCKVMELIAERITEAVSEKDRLSVHSHI